jgi:hypothetical protein
MRGESGLNARVAQSVHVSDRLARRILILLIGIWFGSMLVVVMGVPRSFTSVDHVMADPAPEASKAIREIGPIRARMFLRYQISEANRLLFSAWGWVQLMLGLTVFGVTLFGTKSGKLAIGLAAGMLFIALVTQFLLIPRLDQISRTTDFAPAMATSPESDRFQVLHRGFAAFEVVVGILGAGLLGVLFQGGERHTRRSGGSPNPDTPYGEQFD